MATTQPPPIQAPAEAHPVLLAFHGDPAIKRKYLARVRAHRAADELVHGLGWERGKGRAVGCTLDAYDHARYERELGIPEWLAKWEDAVFEGMTGHATMLWPTVFLASIPVGFDGWDGPWHHLGAARGRRLLALRSVQGERAVHSAVALVVDLHAVRCADQTRWAAARAAARDAAKDAAKDAARDAAKDAARDAAYGQEALSFVRFFRQKI